jgi:hypothetical protein
MGIAFGDDSHTGNLVVGQRGMKLRESTQPGRRGPTAELSHPEPATISWPSSRS